MKHNQRLLKIFEYNLKRAKQSYNPKQPTQDQRTARSSSLNNALQKIQDQIRGIQ